MQINYGGRSDAGLYRDTNQDSLFVTSRVICASQCTMCVLCDGVGSTQAGEVASAETVLHFMKWFESLQQLANDNIQKTVKQQCIEINRLVLDKSVEIGLSTATTMTLLIIIDNIFYVFNVGDSRLYILNEQFYKLTEDDSVIKTIKKNGLIMQKAVLTQFIGTANKLNVFFEQGYISCDTTFLVCSDGFYKTMIPKQLSVLLETLTMGDNINAIIEDLIKKTIRSGETDNITAGIIKVFI